MIAHFVISLNGSADALLIEAEGQNIKLPDEAKIALGMLIGLLGNRQKGQPVVCIIKDEALPQQATPGEKFTEREVEIGKLLVAGYTARSIGEKLFISPQTVGWHRKNLYRKLGIENREPGIKKIALLHAAMLRYNLM